jgi:hypothetical protein
MAEYVPDYIPLPRPPLDPNAPVPDYGGGADPRRDWGC